MIYHLLIEIYRLRSEFEFKIVLFVWQAYFSALDVMSLIFLIFSFIWGDLFENIECFGL